MCMMNKNRSNLIKDRLELIDTTVNMEGKELRL